MLSSSQARSGSLRAGLASPSASMASHDKDAGSAALSNLLHNMHSLLSPITSGGGLTWSSTQQLSNDDRPSGSQLLLDFLRLLCHWYAVRAALPERMDDRFVLRRMAQKQRGGDGVKGSAVAEATVACLLPPFLSAAVEGPPAFAAPTGSQRETSSGAASRQLRDEKVLRSLDTLLSHLSFSATAGHDTDFVVVTGSDGDGEIRSTLLRIRSAYLTIQSDTALLCRPPPLSCGDTAVFLRIYATVCTEIAAAALHRILPPFFPSSLLSCVRACGVVREAFDGLLQAQQVARSALSFFSDTSCDVLLRTRIHPLLTVLTCDGTCTATFLHPAVEVTSDALLSVSGRGLVATAALQEGELLLQERSLLTTPADTMQDGTSDLGYKLEKRLEALLRPAPSGAAQEAEQEEGTVSFGENPTGSAPSSPAKEMLDFFSRCSPAKRAETTWWYRWALALPLSPSPPPLPPPRAAPPQPTMRAYIQEAARAALLSVGSSAQPGVAPPGGEQQSSAVRLLVVREVDEFRLPSPELDAAESVVFHGGGNILLPRPNPDVEAALFCLLHCVNHACTPNAMVVFDADPSNPAGGVVGSLIALRDIDAGEAVNISYVPATTALTVSQAELAVVLGFVCRCSLCLDKAALLHGVLCGECRQLVYEPSMALTHHTGAHAFSPAFSHAPQCSRHRRDAVSDKRDGASDSVAAHLRRALDGLAVQATTSVDVEKSCAGDEIGGDAERGSCCRHSSCCGADAKAGAAAHPPRPDPLVAVVRQLLELDDCVAHALLPTHHLRLRARLEAFAYASVAHGLGSTVSGCLIHVCATTLEELEVLLGVNHPLVTGLRMYLVFSRGRHVRAVEAAAALKHGTRHADCCGAVREQTALMGLPFVLDPLVRCCVMRCFQEHYAQLVGWRVVVPSSSSRAAVVPEAQVLRSFLCRYPVEMEAAGCTTLAHMEMLACMEDGDAME